MITPEKLDALKWRCIGPARGGRVVAVAGDPAEPMVFYFGACAGGIWYNRLVRDVFHGHYGYIGNYARFTLDDGTEVEFRFGRSWKDSI